MMEMQRLEVLVSFQRSNEAWIHGVFSTTSQAVVLALTRSSDGRDGDVTAVLLSHGHSE